MDRYRRPVTSTTAAIADDIKATAQDVESEAGRLAAIEAQKQTLHPGSPALVTLSREAERLAARLAKITRVETDLAEQAAANGSPSG